MVTLIHSCRCCQLVSWDWMMITGGRMHPHVEITKRFQGLGLLTPREIVTMVHWRGLQTKMLIVVCKRAQWHLIYSARSSNFTLCFSVFWLSKITFTALQLLKKLLWTRTDLQHPWGTAIITKIIINITIIALIRISSNLNKNAHCCMLLVLMPFNFLTACGSCFQPNIWPT